MGEHRPRSGHYQLGAPAVDDARTIYVQSAFALYAFGVDGAKRWTVYLDGPQSAEPVSGAFPAPTVVGSNQILVMSASASLAVDLAGQLLWKNTGFGARQTVGHWGIGYDGTASYAFDLRTGKPAGRLTTSNGDDVVTLSPLAGTGILAVNRDTSNGTRMVLLDPCGGGQVWAVDLQQAGLCFGQEAIVGPGEIAFVQMAPCKATSTSQLQIVAIDTATGRIVGGPTPHVETPWVVGSDGTLYAADLGDLNGLTKTRIVALSPDLRELYHVDIDGALGQASAALSDDGVLYAQTSSAVVAVQTTSPGLAQSSWPTYRHDNRSSNWAGGQF